MQRGGGVRIFVAVALAAILLSGCGSMPDLQRNTLFGTAAGIGVGALVGAAIGGATGGAIASLIRPPACYFRNKRGELWQVPCEDLRVRAEACFVGGTPVTLEEVACPWAGKRRGT
jgi:hypothetical protein